MGRMSTGSLERADVSDLKEARAARHGDSPDADAGLEPSEAVSSFTSTVASRRIPARAPNGRFVGQGLEIEQKRDELPGDRYLWITPHGRYRITDSAGTHVIPVSLGELLLAA